MLDRTDTALLPASHRYPTRPEKLILDRLSFVAEAGHAVGLCGPTGSGKSSVMRLLQRYYEPRRGEILLDSRRIADLSLPWLRRHIGCVDQERRARIRTPQQSH